MRKLSLLTVLSALLTLGLAATASAADRYAYPGGDATNIATCAFGENCDLVSAMDTTYVAADSRVHATPGTYTVSAPLSLIASGSVLKGDGAKAADVVINSTVMASPALTLDNGSEAEKFALNTVTSAGTSGGLNVVDGIIDHVAVTATGQNATACTGRDARFVNTLCHATGEFGSAFRSILGPSLSLDFMNSTLDPGPFGWGFAGDTNGAGTLLRVEMFSTIIVEGSGHYLMLGSSGGAPEPEFSAEYSNYPCTQRVIDSAGQSCLAPVGATNQATPPIFKDADNGDFTPAPDSSTVDAGSSTGLSGSKDLAGNARVQGAAADIGAFESSPVVATQPVIVPPADNAPILDVIAPKLTVSKKPKSKTTSKKVSVSFSANEAATYQCKLDKGKFKACKSPYKKSKLKLGKHKLQIRATDAAGNVSSTKTINWRIKKP